MPPKPLWEGMGLSVTFFLIYIIMITRLSITEEDIISIISSIMPEIISIIILISALIVILSKNILQLTDIGHMGLSALW